MLKLSHDGLKSHTTRRKRRSEGGWRGRCLSLWQLRLKLNLTPSNGTSINCTLDGEMIKLGIGDKGVANDPRDSRRKDKHIMGCRILIDIYKGEDEMRREVNREVLFMRDNKNRARDSVIEL